MLLTLVLVKSTLWTNWTSAIYAVLAFGLCLGVFTPLTCVLSCLVELASFFGLSPIDLVDRSFLVLVTASLAVLGPGAYSLDAHRFGRRVIKG